MKESGQIDRIWGKYKLSPPTVRGYTFTATSYSLSSRTVWEMGPRHCPYTMSSVYSSSSVAEWALHSSLS